MKQHTEGPWTCCDHPDQVQVIADGVGRLICDVNAYKGSAEGRANARLIAAAPELFDALHWIVSFCDEHPEWTEEFCEFDKECAESQWLQFARTLVSQIYDQQPTDPHHQGR